MTIDTKNLRTLAEAATPGPWIAAGPSYGKPLPEFYNCVVPDDGTDGPDDICSDTLTSEDALYIAACSPDVLLALLDALDRKDAALTKVAALLKRTPKITRDIYVGSDSKAWGVQAAEIYKDIAKD